MTGYLLTARGGQIDLPPFTAWKLKRTGSVPCDSFEGTCPWDGGMESAFQSAYRLIVEENGERRFTGVLDEYRLTWGDAGGELQVSGRGMAALLLDNEAEGQDYQVATLADILKNHVEPYGITVEKTGNLPAVPDFSVAAGSSEWQVLDSFARYYGGVEPRFDAWGRLTVAVEENGKLFALDHRNGVTAVAWRDKRYGVYSEVLVRDRGTVAPLTTQRVTNNEFLAQGGRCRRVITMPGKSAYQAMRYSGQYQLDRSAAERYRLELTVPGTWLCEPGDRVAVSLAKPAVSGTWRVLETEAVLDAKGPRVTLTLG